MSDREVSALAFPSEAVLAMPGSKSEANRLLAAAALSPFAHELIGLPDALDVRHMERGLRAMGYGVVDVDGSRVRVSAGRDESVRAAEIFCGNAGTAARFLCAIAAITPGDWTLAGDAYLAKRPVQPLVDALCAMGFDVSSSDGAFPVRVRGGRPAADCVSVDASVSSQFASALMLIAPALDRGLTLAFDGEVASRRYLDLTCRALRQAGATVEVSRTRARVEPGFASPTGPLPVTGDWSAMGVWTCLNHLTGSRIRGEGLVAGSDQADEALAHVLTCLDGPGERSVDVEPLPDQFLNLAIVAALRDGTTHFTGATNVRAKECDRVAVVARELRRCGAELDERADGVTVRGGASLHGAAVDPEGDHRVAIAFALLGSVVTGVRVRGADCVRKSYPGFWEDLASVHAKHRAIALVGMRGAGKTTLGRALAQRIDSRFLDADQQFETRHGPIPKFVEARGWSAFRTAERAVVTDCLARGVVVATGGGCVEDPAVRRLLTERAFVVSLEAPVEVLAARVADGSRPSLTGAPVTEEVAEVLERRRPLYEAIADRRVDATLPLSTQLTQASAHQWRADARR